MARNDAEFRLTCAVAQHLRLAATQHTMWLHIPNGEARSPRTGARLKAMGVIPGAGDFLLTRPDERPLMLELKVKGGRQSQTQRLFETRWTGAGGLYVLAEGIDEALAALRSYGALPEGYAFTPSRRLQPSLAFEAA